MYFCLLFFFFFQAEDGIRDKLVTGVQTCALPICLENVAGQKNAYAFGSIRDHLTTFDDACGNKAVCGRLAARPHGLAFDSILCLPMLAPVLYSCAALRFGSAGGGCPHTNERSRRECPTHSSLLIKPGLLQ